MYVCIRMKAAPHFLSPSCSSTSPLCMCYITVMFKLVTRNSTSAHFVQLCKQFCQQMYTHSLHNALCTHCALRWRLFRSSLNCQPLQQNGFANMLYSKHVIDRYDVVLSLCSRRRNIVPQFPCDYPVTTKRVETRFETTRE